MICLNLPEPFDNVAEQATYRYLSLNGQNKSALQKSTVGGWQYDILEQGFKANMTDLCAAIGLAQLRQYEDVLLPERRKLFELYNEAFADFDWAILPPMSDDKFESSCHLYQLRIRGIDEDSRNEMMQYISEKGFGVNVHYVPLPMLTLFRNLGYRAEDFPSAIELYENEISLPLYNNLSSTDALDVAKAVIAAYSSVT